MQKCGWGFRQQLACPCFGAVAVGSFAVHVAVLSNTSWVSDFLSGQPLGLGDAKSAALTTKEMNAETTKASYATPLPDGTEEVQVILQDGTVVKAVLQRNEVLAWVSPTVLPDTD